MCDQINELKTMIHHRNEAPTGKDIRNFLELIQEIRSEGVDLQTLKKLIKE